MGNWDELQQDLIVLVAKRISLLEDFLAFGGVCRSWRLAAVKENFKGSSQVPWLMLAEEEEEEGEDDDDDDEEEEEEEEEEKKSDESRRFVCLTRGGMIRRFAVPEAKGKRCLESLGWLVTMSKQGEMNLVHPFSRVQIDLPHLNTYMYVELLEPPMEDNYFFLQKAVLSSSPSTTDDYVLAVICGAESRLLFWRPGDKSWTTIVTRQGIFCDVTYYKGQFYGANCGGQVFICDVGGPGPTLARYDGEITGVNFEGKRIYLVELAGRLLAVIRDGCDVTISPGDFEYHYDYGATEFLVFDTDINKQITNLGDYALFLGDNTSISLDVSKFPEVKPNCIYYTDDNWRSYYDFLKRRGGKDMGIYNLEDRTRMPHYNGKQSLSHFSPPIWVTPSFF